MVEFPGNVTSRIERNAEFHERGPFSLLIAASIAFALQSLAVIVALGSDYNYLQEVSIGLVLLSFLGVLVVWPLLTIAFWILGKLLGGQPAFGQLLQSTVYGFGPFTVTGLAWALGNYLALRDEPFDYESQFRPGLGKQRELYFDFVAQRASDPLFLVLEVVGLAFLALAAYFWVVALKHNSELDDQLAAVAVGVPVFVFALWLVGLI